MTLLILMRGGGDLASGVALRLIHSGLKVIITELPEPLMVRRTVSFAEAVYAGKAEVEGVAAVLAEDWSKAQDTLLDGCVPVLVDPGLQTLENLRGNQDQKAQIVLVDARMNKKPPEKLLDDEIMQIGLGPGFYAGLNCHAVIETNRGHNLGRVIWQGTAEEDTGVPESVISQGRMRVLRAENFGTLVNKTEIGEHLEQGQIIAEISGHLVQAPFRGVLRGLLHSGLEVWPGLKIGDVDPRDDPKYCFQVSDKSLAVGGAVLEAILSQTRLRPFLWDNE